ncbi:MAG: hypothetical protein M1839_003514 [Geoglossum umbratile]|nr:MAG: hypothetical protein M1839_003514 [Geoglossum umbratile]
MSLTHTNPPGSTPPYRDLFHNVTIVPAGCKLAFISSQWACDESGQLIPDGKGNYKAQARQAWKNVIVILEGLGCGMKDVVHKKNCFTEFSEDIAKECIEGALEACGEAHSADFMKSSNAYGGYSHFHIPDILFMVDIIAVIPN